MLFRPDLVGDEKQARILDAAMQVFSRYGYRRASMEDIAREAGMSRAALYQHFRNKEDILDHGVVAYFRMAADDLRAALNADASLEDRVRAGITAQAGEMARFLLDSPHGEELLSVKSGSAGQGVQGGMQAFAGVWTDWLARMEAEGQVTLPASPAATAEVILSGQAGQKTAAAGYDDYVERLATYATLICRSLRP